MRGVILSSIDLFPGDKVELRSTFRTKPPLHELVDPLSVSILVKRPTGALVSVAVTQESTGVYFGQYTIQESGTHYFRFFGSDPADKSDESFFVVEDSRVGAFVVLASGSAALSSIGASGTGAA